MDAQPNAYSEGRRRPDKAASYDTKYDREFLKRISKRRENGAHYGPRIALFERTRDS